VTQINPPATRLQPLGLLPAPAAGFDPAARSAASSYRGTVAIHTHGCKLNQADGDVLARRFVEAGYRIVDWTAGADVLVLNTCTVTAAADAKARQTLRAAARRANGKAVIVATGCYAERSASGLERLGPAILVMGNARKAELVSAVTATLADQEGTKSGRSPGHFRTGAAGRAGDPLKAGAAPPATGRNRAMIKIQEGCNQICAYCIVPKVRGRERSIPPDMVLRQVLHRVDQGCREVVLTGTQLGAYGHDIAGASLLKLLQLILARSAVPRIRVSSLQAQEITSELLDLWEDRRLCPHFHVPLQSGSDRILAAMRRRYDTDRFARTVDLVRWAVPDAGITTDLIVGFPGEGDGEFQDSLRFVRSMQFSDMHIFPYSPRPGTSAARLAGKIPDPAKKARAAEMLKAAAEGFRAFRHRQLGKTRPVLWEVERESGPPPVWSGLTDNYIRVSIEDRRDLRNSVAPARLMGLSGDWVTSQAP
jgi:threonylcarbamoyladenosine tRNA methylthiotransferase MtaB